MTSSVVEKTLRTCLSLNTFSVPSRVPAFKVTSIAATHVTLCWETIPLTKQNGAILYYQIGVDKKENGKYQLFIHDNTAGAFSYRNSDLYGLQCQLVHHLNPKLLCTGHKILFPESKSNSIFSDRHIFL